MYPCRNYRNVVIWEQNLSKRDTFGKTSCQLLIQRLRRCWWVSRDTLSLKLSGVSNLNVNRSVIEVGGSVYPLSNKFPTLACILLWSLTSEQNKETQRKKRERLHELILFPVSLEYFLSRKTGRGCVECWLRPRGDSSWACFATPTDNNNA